MSSSSFLNDIFLTHSIVNFLTAGYQGAFASLNLLSQLGFQHFNPDDFTRIERNLSEIDKWKDDLFKGLPIFSAGWKSPQTVDAKKAFELLSELRSDLIQCAGRVKKILLSQDLAGAPEDVKYLISAFTRQAYARENYVRGFVEFGQSFKHPEIVNTYSQFLPEAEQSINAAHMFYQLFVSEEALAPVYYTGLSEECSFLPGIFQSQVHDIHLLLNSYTENLSYSALAILPQYHSSWKSIEVNPITAGYWQAWEFAPEIAATWIEAGQTDPRTAWFWLNQGFLPSEAAEWALAGFPPPAARAWKSQGYSAESAGKAIEEQMLGERLAQQQSEMPGTGESRPDVSEDGREDEEGENSR